MFNFRFEFSFPSIFGGTSEDPAPVKSKTPEHNPYDGRNWYREESPPPAPVVMLQKRGLPTPEPTPPRPHKRPRSTADQHQHRAILRPENKSAEFYLSSGNVVIRVHTTLFKLDWNTLARNCTYFDVLFRQSGAGDIYEVIDNCRVYDAPKDLIVGDFTRLLAALKDPLSYFDKDPTQAIALSVLRAAHTLSCNVLHVLARTRLIAIWDSRLPPPPLPRPAADDDDAGSMVHLEAIHMLSIASEYSIPLARIEKRVLYTLLSSRAFWAARAADPAQISVGDDVLIRLQDARHAIEREWRDFVLVPPGARPSARVSTSANGGVGQTTSTCVAPYRTHRGPGFSVCGTRTSADERNRRWKTFMTDEGVMEDGAVDPIRYALMKREAGEALRGTWCDGCLEKWERGWMAKREEWWGKLDGWLKLTQ